MPQEREHLVPVKRMKSFQALGTREQNAVNVVLEGLIQHQTSDVREAKPIRIIATGENPFNLRDFAGVLHSVGIDITSTMKREKRGKQTLIVFQPKYYPDPQSATKAYGTNGTLKKIISFLAQ